MVGQLPFSVGAFERVYDPSAGLAERWYINDHTFFRDSAAGMAAG